MSFLWLIPLSVISGILGRMGGAHGYNTKYRDIGCSIIVVITLIVIFGWYSSFWWVYLLVFVLHWASFCTYWDKVFGYDNLWFSGFVTGACIAPIIFIWWGFWWIVLLRAVFLCIVWGALNKYLPYRIGLWKRDVVEEFCRYAASL